MSEEFFHEILNELKMIKNLLIITNKELIENFLESIITTQKRKLMWCLINGENTTKKIAEMTKTTTRAVQYFLSDLFDFGLIALTKNSPPKKILNYIPPEWLKLKEKELNLKKL
ncbi:MAG: hypothetical protein ACTSVV_11655 [Promethearchaeota archaeon]